MLPGVLYCLVQPTFMYCLCFLALVCYFSVNMQPETSRSNEKKFKNMEFERSKTA